MPAPPQNEFIPNKNIKNSKLKITFKKGKAKISSEMDIPET